MLRIEIRNFNELEEPYVDEVRKMIKTRQEYYENLFKKYDKDLIIDITFNKDKEYRVSIGINMKSKDILIVETDRDPVAALRRAFAEFKKAVKRQIAHERKDYLYKRKRYRQQKWKLAYANLVEDAQESAKEDKPKYSRKVKNALKAVHKYLKSRLKELGLTKKQVKAQLPALIEAVERRFYRVFDPKQHGPEDLDALLFGIAEEILAGYQNTGAEAEGETLIDEFEGDAEAPAESVYEEEKYFIEDITKDENLAARVNERYETGEIDEMIRERLAERSRGDQAVLHLHYMEQFDADDIARITKQDKSQVEKTIDDFRRDIEQMFNESVK